MFLSGHFMKYIFYDSVSLCKLNVHIYFLNPFMKYENSEN